MKKILLTLTLTIQPLFAAICPCNADYSCGPRNQQFCNIKLFKLYGKKFCNDKDQDQGLIFSKNSHRVSYFNHLAGYPDPTKYYIVSQYNDHQFFIDTLSSSDNSILLRGDIIYSYNDDDKTITTDTKSFTLCNN